MNNPLNKIINLAKRTGDRVIVTDTEGSEAFVVMNLDEYEKMIGAKDEIRDLSEDELLSKINRDIAIWKSTHEEVVGQANIEQKTEKAESDDFMPKIKKTFRINSDSQPLNEIEEDERFYFEPIE